MTESSVHDPDQPSAPVDPLREQLLEAAAAVFAAKGYAGAKIMDIVREARLSSGAVYGRFASKDELLVAAVIRQVEGNAAAREFEGKTVGQVLVEASRAAGPLTDPEATQLEAFIAARREQQVADAIAAAREHWRATTVADLIERAIEDGSASPDADFGSIVYFLESLRLGLLVQRGAGQEAPDIEAWQRFLDRMIRAIAATDES